MYRNFTKRFSYDKKLYIIFIIYIIMPNPLMNGMFQKHMVNWEVEKMTLDGTINKSMILLWITILSAIWVWSFAEIFIPLLIPIIIISTVVAFIVIFFKKTASYLSPVYAILEWLSIWVISAFYEAQFPGIVLQAVSLTFWVFIMMLTLYKSKLIKVTENFKTGIVAAT